MKIIIFGASEIGCLLATEFFEEHDITIIDREENRSEDFNKLDISFVYGNGSNINILKQAQIDDADIFIACTTSDETNIVSCLMAKQISNAVCVCFVSKAEYIESIALMNNKENSAKRLIDYVIWPEELLTKQIYKLITTPSAITVEDFVKGKAGLFEYRVKNNSQLLNKKIMDCHFPENVLIVGISSNENLYVPNGQTELKLNDKVIFMGLTSAIEKIANNYFGNREKIDNVSIIGGGNVGFMLAKKLEDAYVKVKIIENDYERCNFLSKNLNKTLVLYGDGTNIDLLRDEQIADSDVVITVTNSDQKNLLCSLLAKQLGINKVITRVSKSPNINLFEKVGIDVAVSPNGAAIKEIKTNIVEKDLSILTTVEQGQGEIIEVKVSEKFNNKKIMDLKLPAKAIIAIIQRDNDVIIPKGQTEIMSNDSLIIFTMQNTSQVVKDYFN